MRVRLPLRRRISLATAILAMTTAGVLVPPTLAGATTGAGDSDPTSRGDRGRETPAAAPAAAPADAQASLSLNLHAAQPAPTGKDPGDPFLSAVAGETTILVVSLRALAIADRTSASTAPSFVVTLPAGLTFVSVADSLDPDVSGSWSCTGKTTVMCALGVTGSTPGRMTEGQAAQAILTLASGAAAAPDVALGDISVSASVKAQDTGGTNRTLTATATMPVTGASDVPPDILVREIPAPAERQRNVLTLRTIALGDLVAADPEVTLKGLVPDGAANVTVDDNPDWTCSSAKSWSCTSTGILAPGSPTDVTVRFAVAKGRDALQWTVGTSYSGGQATQNAQIPGGFVVRQPRAVLDPASFEVQLRSPKGQGIAIGGDHVLQVVVTNRSLDAYTPRLALQVPTGLRLAESGKEWTCTGDGDIECVGPRLAADASSQFLLRVVAGQSVKPGIAMLVARVTPGDNPVVRHPLHVLDPGDPIPAIDLRRFVRGSTQPWNDGRAINAPVGQDTSYRVVLRNVGGVPLEAGRSFTAGQTADRGVRFVSVDAGQGVQCSVAAGGIAWTCTMTASTRRPVGAVVGSATVTVRPSDRFDQVPLSPVSARVTGSNADAVLEPVQIRGIVDELPLRVRTTLRDGVTVGGTATATLRIHNESRRSVTGVVVVGNLPSGVSARAKNSDDWACVPSREQVSCTFAGRVKAGAHTSTVQLVLSADRTATVGSRLARWRATGVSPTSAAGRGATRILIHGRVNVTAEALPSSIGVRPPRARATSVILHVESKSPRTRVWRHTWEQACLTSAELQAVPECAGATTSLVRIIEPQRRNAIARIPVARQDATYVFKVTARDGSAGIVDYVTVTAAGWTDAIRPALPRIDARTGLAPVAVQPTRTSTTAAIAVRELRARAHVRAWLRLEALESTLHGAGTGSTAVVPDVTLMSRAALFQPMAAPLKVSITGGALIDATTGSEVTLPAIASGGSKPYTYEWDQIVGSKPDLTSTTTSTTTLVGESGHKVVTYQVTVTDASGQTALDTVTVVFNPSITTQFCSMWNKAESGAASMVRQLGGGIEAKFKQIEVIGKACTPDAAFTFSGTTLTYGGFTISDVSGIVTAGGIAVSAGSLSAPSGWGLGDLQIGDAGLVIALAETSGGAATMNGRFTVRSFAFLPVPSGWWATTKVIFSVASGQTSMSLVANADGPGGATASLSGSVSSDGTFKVTGTANDIVSIGDGEIDATGTIQLKEAGGSLSGSLKGSLATPATIVDGVTIPSLSIVWDTNANTVVSGSGTLQLDADGDTIDIDMSVDYSSAKDWVVRVKGGGTASWEPVSGLEIQPSDFSGSLKRVSGDYDWQIEASLSTPWQVTDALTLSSLSITIANSCPASVKQAVTCPKADTFLGIAGSATVDSDPVAAFTADIAGVVAIGGGSGMALAASIDGDITITSGLDLTNATLTATYGITPEDSGPDITNTTEDGFTVAITADVDVASVGSFSDLQVNVTGDGWSFAAFSSGIQLGDPDSYGDFGRSVMAYATMPTTVTAPPALGIDPVVYVACGATGTAPAGKVCADSVYVAGTYTAPGWFTKAVGGTALTADALVELDPSDGTFDARVDVPLGSGASLPTGGSSSLTTGSLFFELQQVSGHVVVTAGGDVDLGLPSSSFGSAPPTLQMDMSYDVTSDTLQAALSYNDPSGWQDAFGMPGLDLFELTVALQINLNTLTPALGLSADADLPGTVENAFFTLNPSTPVQAFVDLSLDTPCLGVTIGTQGPNAPVAFSVGGGVLTASYIELYVAPDGCMIGTTVYPVGYRFAFDGTILDTPVAANVEVGLDPVSIDATLSVGSFQVGPLLVDQTAIGIDFVSGLKDEISFSGGFELFDTGVTASGDLDYEEATSTTSASLDIDVTNFGVNGFELKNADIGLSLTSSPGNTDIQFDGSASMDILGDTLDIKEFDFTVENNVVTAVSADVTTTLVLGGGVSFNGAFNLAYTSTPQDFSVAADVTVAMDDFTLTSAKLSITPSCADVDASFDIPGLLSASVGGYVIYGANCTVTDALTGVTTSISGTDGAFCVFVDNADVGLAGFEASGSASVSNNGDLDCSGTATTADDIVGSLEVDLVLGSQSVANTAHISGSFNSDGTYSFTGSDQLNIGGFNLDMTVTAAKDDAGETVQGSAEIQMLGNDLTFSGSFSNENDAVSVVLEAQADPLSLGGFDLGSGMVRLAQTPDEFGMTFEMTLNAGVASMQSTLTFNEVNGDYLFYTYVDLTLGVPGIISASAAGSFTNCATPSCQAFGGYTLTASVSFTFGGWSYTSPEFEISTGGQFSFSVSDSRCCESTSATDVAGVNWWTANDSWSVSLTVNQDGVSGSASGEATVYSQEVALKYPCGPWYWVFKDWCSYGVTDWGAIGASASINPWSFCFRIAGSPWICI